MVPFVQDGRQRAINGIRAEVEKKYEKQLRAATAEQRKVLNKKIKAEIREATERRAPRSARY